MEHARIKCCWLQIPSSPLLSKDTGFILSSKGVDLVFLLHVGKHVSGGEDLENHS